MKEAVVDLAASANSAARARWLVREFLNATVEADALDSAALVVSELVTNAILYARPPIRLVLKLDEEVLRVEVQDGSERLPHLRHYTPDSVTGRGLHLVGAYGQCWGSDAHAGGKSVWCDVAARRSHGPGPATSRRA